MKTTKKLITLLLALLGLTQAAAQEYEYVPFVREGVKWVCYYGENYNPVYDDPNKLDYFNLEFKGDTIINGKTYKLMHKYHGDSINTVNDTVAVCMREEDKVVYAFVPDGKFYCPIGNYYRESDFKAIQEGREFVLYDFKNPIAYWSNFADSCQMSYYDFIETDLISVGNHLVKAYSMYMSGLGGVNVIEGIGLEATNSYPLAFFLPSWPGAVEQTVVGLKHVIENGEIIYNRHDYDGDNPDWYEYEYVPFVREGVKWVYGYDNPFYEDVLNMPDGCCYFAFEMKGDTVYEGKHYKPVKLYYINYDGEEIEQDFTPIWLREEDKVVYACHLDGMCYPQCPVGYFNFVAEDDKAHSTSKNEFVLYDFNNPFTLYDEWMWNYMDYDYLGTDYVKVGSHNCKRHKYMDNYGFEFFITEGVGCDGKGMPLFYFPAPITGMQVGYGLSHVIENGEIVYKGKWFNDGDLYMPLLREGVKWVYEKVMVHEGDTTCYYYTYEISGMHPNHPNYSPDYHACHYYIGNGYTDMNLDNDSLIAAVYEFYSIFDCYENHALIATVNAGKNMLNYRTPTSGLQVLYWGLGQYDSMMGSLKDDLIENQREPYFSDENLVMADPIVIENCKCSRLAYLNEQGDTLAYVVEGIGFDSYDMGDLLTPFTLKSDPNADYQEWCGLSHVIKDGKIIYKGMRYRELYGDVDGDGEVTIADANSVIDIVIMGGNSAHTRTPAADVNSDGEVSIADVNAIIEIILGKN